jgi:hypothetical protein
MDGVQPLTERKSKVIGNGHCWQGQTGFRPYHFRRWAFAQPEVTYVPHAIESDTPKADRYQLFLSEYVGALALCDAYVVPKYLEIPLAGCVCLAQYHYEYEKMGFFDGYQCLYVTKKNLRQTVRDVLSEPGIYQDIATAGRIQALAWSPEQFAEAIYEKG